MSCQRTARYYFLSSQFFATELHDWRRLRVIILAPLIERYLMKPGWRRCNPANLTFCIAKSS